MKVIIVDDDKKDLKTVADIVTAVLPDADIDTFDDAPAALAKARSEEIDMAFLDVRMPELDGVELGRYLKDLNPFINIIFCTAHKEYGYEAMDMHASGYMLKPASEEKVRIELSQLRFAERYNDHKRIFAQTFGNFELFVDGKPAEFKYNRTKELVALLINNKGAFTTNGEIIATMWEDDGDPEKKTSYLSNIRQDLMNTFMRLKLDGIIIKQRGKIAIAKDRIECDLYDWLEKKDASKYKYVGEYMMQYEWSEDYIAELDELSYGSYDDDDD